MTQPEQERLARARRLFQERVDSQDAGLPGYASAWASFESVLLRHGGAAVVPPGSPDPMLGVFTKEGDVVSPRRIEVVDGNASDCHANVVALWRSGEVAALGTGYGLNGDLWREHSWGWKGGDDGQLVETTQPRDRYFGVRLTGGRALWFADWIDPPQT
jgi:hypothetical protein